jgi:hypothetical protein
VTFKRVINREGETAAPPSRGLATGVAARRIRALRSPSRSQSPPTMREREKEDGKGDADSSHDHDDYISLEDPKHFSLKTLDIENKSMKYREWVTTIKRYIKPRPKTGKAVIQAICWAEEQDKTMITEKVLYQYPDERIDLWEGEVEPHLEVLRGSP